MKKNWTQYLMNQYGLAWWKMNESSGGMIDSKGNATSTLTNVTMLGKEGYSFNGTSSKILFTNKLIPDRVSLYFEIKADSNSENVKMILSEAYDGTTAGSSLFGLTLGITTNNHLYVAENRGIADAENFISPDVGKVIADNQWHRILYQWDGTLNDAVVYIDDMKVPEYILRPSETKSYTATSNLAVGMLNPLTNIQAFKGQLRNIQIFNEIIDPISDLHFVKSEGKIYTFVSDMWIDTDKTESSLTESDYLQNGIVYLDQISEASWALLRVPLEILTYTKLNESFLLETAVEEFSPLQEIQKNGEFEVITWTDSEEDLKLELTVPEYRPISLLEDPKLLIWTDREEPLELLVNINESKPVDILGDKMTLLSKTQQPIGDYQLHLNTTITPKYRYKVEIVEPHAVIQDWSNYTTEDLSTTIIIPQRYINQSLNPYLIRVTVETDAQNIVTREFLLNLYNTEPELRITMTGMGVHIEMSDPEEDRIRYKILLNGQQIFPEQPGYSEWLETTDAIISYRRVLRSNQITVGGANVFEAYVEDEYGEKSSLEYIFEGEYSGLLFSDEEQNYYTTDLGELLKYLDFGVIYQGQTTSTYKVLVHNRNGFTINNWQVWLEQEKMKEQVVVQIDSNEMFANPRESISYEGQYEHGSIVELYVRITTTKTAGTGEGEFEVVTRAEPFYE